MKPKKLLDFYKTPYKNGIFFSLSQNALFSPVFAKLGLNIPDDIHSMDVDYLYNHSGLKTLSCMLEHMLDGFVIDDTGIFVNDGSHKRVTWDYVIQDIDTQIINTIIRVKYLKKWEDLAETLFLEFDALNPYSMTVNESGHENLSSESKDDVTTTNDITDNSSDGTTSENNNTSSEKNYRSAFNSSTPSPFDNSDDTSKDEYTETVTRERTTKNDGTRNSKNDYSRNTTNYRDITRKGNIGNHTSQELINQQREMLRYQIFDTIYSDLDSVLTRSKYII